MPGVPTDNLSGALDRFHHHVLQEKELDDLGIEQNLKIDPTECVDRMQKRHGRHYAIVAALHREHNEHNGKLLMTEDARMTLNKSYERIRIAIRVRDG